MHRYLHENSTHKRCIDRLHCTGRALVRGNHEVVSAAPQIVVEMRGIARVDKPRAVFLVAEEREVSTLGVRA